MQKFLKVNIYEKSARKNNEANAETPSISFLVKILLFYLQDKQSNFQKDGFVIYDKPLTCKKIRKSTE